MKLYRCIYLKHLSAALYTITVIGFFIFDLDMNYLIRNFNTCITLKPFRYHSYSKKYLHLRELPSSQNFYCSSSTTEVG